ncbi:MAG: PglZ domain-containing protein [Verrucomicrobiae bacterium]|nr:PglZ domain-containing protein [Verrucomicrobiae bacterium]NNJ42144.1 PglZ domain-containing protein [Akkermansiaceae bacterium]
MTFAEHIRQNIFLPRLTERRILVVYDEHDRFREICAGLNSEQCKVIFTDKRPVSSRQEAMERWKEMSMDQTYQSQMLIHCNDPAPKDDDERQEHPLASYAAVGASFPSRASDEYKQLCYGFLKDRTAEIDQLFAGDTEPTFSLIDNLSAGSHSHPQLQELFGTGDASKIIPNFLVPPEDSEIEDLLDSNTGWCQEMRELLKRTLGLGINTKSTKAVAMRDKLWQFLLFSEFCNDLPGGIPSTLADLPRATGAQLPFALSLCADLRLHTNKKESYRDAALKIEAALDLEQECVNIIDLGMTDTFSFEEKNFLKQAATAIRAREWDTARTILDSHKTSLWTEEGERKLLWHILELGLDTLEQIKRAEIHLKHLGHEGKELCELFDTELIKVDRTYRNLEDAAAQIYQEYGEVEDIINATRQAYRNHFNQLQANLLGVVQREGWPLNGMPSNQSSYNDQVHTALRNNKRVVYFLIDALRLDLAQDLVGSIHDHQVSSVPACAQLPCVTRFGMASLLPDAEDKLKFIENGGEIIPIHGETNVKTRTARLGVFESMLNDRVTTSNLADFISNTRTPSSLTTYQKKTAQCDLLVLTSTELDALGEGQSTSELQLIPSVMRKLKLAISRCAELEYDTAVIATDHGFIWVEDSDAGSVCEKPAGEWPLIKRRCLIGQGDDTPGTQKFTTKELSIPTELPSFVVPKALATFSKGVGYFHEGLSLQESIVPRVVINFTKAATSQSRGNPEVELSRKKKNFSSRIVSVNIAWPGSPDMFSECTEFKLVAFQNRHEIGFPSSGEKVDPASGLIKMKQGEAIKVSLRLTEDAKEGPVHIKAINPATEKVIDSLELNFKSHVF